VAIGANQYPKPFSAGMGYVVVPNGGIPPYSISAMPSPPNPPGVTVSSDGHEALVDVPAGTPPGTRVYIQIYDSSTPPQGTTVTNMVR
jgi:hypothetical protein